MNHLSYAARDVAKTRDWYVDLFGMQVRWDDGRRSEVVFGTMPEPNGIYIVPLAQPTDQPGVRHLAFGAPMTYIRENKAAMKAEMERRGLKNIRPDSEYGWSAVDPAGYDLNTWVAIRDNSMFPGAAGPCEVVNSDKCREGWQAGLKNLANLPKPSGRGFKAVYFSNIVIDVPEADIPKEKEFYSGMYGMKILSDNRDGVSLQFGKNTLSIRKTPNPGDKPYCRHFGFAVENYDQAKAKAELDRRGLNPKAGPGAGWTIQDLNGMTVEITKA
ncbi:MAG: VOC family protein [Acidobacteria bacterium]|nr:VOC family protein [Acidobacteriota bacterium]